MGPMARQRHLSPERVTLATTSSRLAVFDLDRTLIAGSSLVRLGRALVGAGLLPRRRLAGAAALEARYRLVGAGDTQVAGLQARALRAVAGLDRRDLTPVIEAVAEDLVAEVTPGARYLVDQHLDAGDFCMLLSASPHELVEAIARRLGLHRGVGTRTATRGYRLTGELEGPSCYGSGKVEHLVSSLGRIDLTDARAYADSASDLPLLEAVGHPVAVNPDAALRRHAEEQGWPVLRLA